MSEVPVSKQYLHSINKLYEDHLEKRITDQELSKRLDELNEEEVQRLGHLGPVLVRQALEGIEKDIAEDQKKVFEAKDQQKKIEQAQQQQKELAERRERDRKEWNERKAQERKAQEEQRTQQMEQNRQEQERLSFREVAARNISEREMSAKKLQQQYNILQIILLVFSTTTATLAGIDGIPRGFVALTGAIATIAGGLLTTFKLQDRIYANHKAAAELRLECQKYDYHIDEYKDMIPAAAFIQFSRVVNLIQGEQMLQEVELWNPKRDEGKKAQPEIRIDQLEEEQSEKTQVADIPEEHAPEELFVENDGSNEMEYQVVPSSSENPFLR